MKYKLKKISGDASFREFYRLKKNNSSSIIVNAKKDKYKNLIVYTVVNNILNSHKINAPKLLSNHIKNNMIEITDLGEKSFYDHVARKKNKLSDYKLLINLLIKIQKIKTKPQYKLGKNKVKILKYYPGAEITGVVKLDDDSMNMDGVRLLFERDAFSDEDGNEDNDTYFIPIGATDVNADGTYSFLAPAGQIRVSAFIGEFDPSADQDTIRDGSFATGLSEILELENLNSRNVNAVTSILGGVSNMTWIGETLLNVSGAEANREVDFSDSVDVLIKHSGASGSVLWTGHESFEGESLDGVEMVLDNIWTTMENYTLTTTSGDFTTEDVRILEGSGEAVFGESGTFTSSEGLAVVTNFTGNYTRIIEPTRSYFANGTWSGFGVIDAVYTNFTEAPGACDQDITGDILPENETQASFATRSRLHVALTPESLCSPACPLAHLSEAPPRAQGQGSHPRHPHLSLYLRRAPRSPRTVHHPQSAQPERQQTHHPSPFVLGCCL